MRSDITGSVTAVLFIRSSDPLWIDRMIPRGAKVRCSRKVAAHAEGKARAGFERSDRALVEGNGVKAKKLSVAGATEESAVRRQDKRREEERDRDEDDRCTRRDAPVEREVEADCAGEEPEKGTDCHHRRETA
jgi:hypothetical protein